MGSYSTLIYKEPENHLSVLDTKDLQGPTTYKDLQGLAIPATSRNPPRTYKDLQGPSKDPHGPTGTYEDLWDLQGSPRTYKDLELRRTYKDFSFLASALRNPWPDLAF